MSWPLTGALFALTYQLRELVRRSGAEELPRILQDVKHGGWVKESVDMYEVDALLKPNFGNSLLLQYERIVCVVSEGELTIWDEISDN